MARSDLRMDTFIDFDFGKLKKDMKKIMKDSLEGAGDNIVQQLKDNITTQKYFKSTPISKATKSVRMLRGRSGTKPLQDTGRLLKSIKKTKKGITALGYGERQHEGFTLKPNYKGKYGFYAPNKKAKAKRLILLDGGSLKIPARPWIRYEIDNKTYNDVFNKLIKSLGIPLTKISSLKTSV